MTAPSRFALPLALLLSALPALSLAQTYEYQKSVPGLRVSGTGTGTGSQPDTQTPTASAKAETSTSFVNFGSVATHTTEKRQVVLTNTGNAGLGLTAAPAVLGDLAFGTDLTTCETSLAAGQSCLTDVLFSPTAVGAVSGSLRFSTSIAGAPADVTLQGDAYNPVSLASTTLPKGMLGQVYSFDFKQLLSVSNETSPDKSLATWTGSGTLPTGLSFNTGTGVLSGTPSVLNPGAEYTVAGTYKNNQGQQVFTIIVGEAVLQVVQVAAGSTHTCAVTITGGLKCWGRNNNGQLGNNSTATSPVPVAVSGLTSGVTRVAVGENHTCAVTTAGGLKCWGDDSLGQLGNDATLSSKSFPVDVLGMTSGVASVTAGRYHTCAATSVGGLKCWGYDGNGQLGNDVTRTDKPTPVDVLGLTSDVASVSAGAYHTCAVTISGGLKCWGDDSYGQLGNDVTLTSKPTPVDVLGMTSGVASVSAGAYHACAVTAAGGLKCWGRDATGQLGDASTSDKPTPVDVRLLTSGVASVSAGGAHTCAVTTTRDLKCWGSSGFGALGIGNASGNLTTPVAVTGLSSGVTSVSAGGSHACAVTTAGDLKCWGWDAYGQLGNDAALSNTSSPVNVAP